ncbi:heavy metal-binding domain-containing protein [Telmatocola sphagniphila]|uniref:Heavy metal-binding domain-containing protein n=1 Tax=Telmatocola sphagniphila TaxID=1123043 RepID=A0A8E6B7W4_9BACT|nr:heavy metal-binding domain-containing protein [Telmatocola sphagniphila]QVL33119.1 heavy metal-binding domain-containing protein [Telmatocola sphagniphila]
MIISGFSGNEIYCLAQKGWAPGSIVVGNSVQSLGFVGGISSSFKTLSGGEIENLTKLITEGRHAAINRLEKEAQEHGAHGVTGVTSDLKQFSGLKEFIAIGTSIKGLDHQGEFFTTACTGQDFYCQVDAGYEPRHFVMGNVAYALGMGRGVLGTIKGFAGGEVKQFSEMYNHTRHLALERIEKEAKERGANAVVDIQTHILPIGVGAKEMLMVGSASYHPALGNPLRPVTSELTGEELWNLTKMGYAPLRLLLGTSVYSLGLARGLGAFFKGLSRGEVHDITQLIYEARANCLSHIDKEANEIGADAVIGVKVYIYEIGSSFLEVMAIGTAIKKMPGLSTQTETLLPQAIIRDRNTYFDDTHYLGGVKRPDAANS